MLIAIEVLLLGVAAVAACEITRGQIRRLLATPARRRRRSLSGGS